MAEVQTSRHLFYPPRYQGGDGSWSRAYEEALLQAASGGRRLHWEPGAAMSINSHGYAFGDLTLLREVRRQPWLSEVGLDGKPHFLEIPPHDTLWDSYPSIARRLADLLADEAETACRDFDEVYVLLTGGLDSRITAGTLARLLREGRIKNPPVAVTWGLPETRDVVFAREIARMLGFEWIHIPMDPEVLLRNVEWTVKSLAGMISPINLHMMEGMARLPRQALVLATSYGDSVGRAEFSGKHLLELSFLKPRDPFGIIAPGARQEAFESLNRELQALHARTPGKPQYVLCEHEMQGHYMRGIMGHAMSSINDFCSVYQMFTAPEVYSYMWSLHPSLRYNETYGELLDLLDPRLARLPWARTNRGLKGTSMSSAQTNNLRPRFHLYTEWISGPLYNRIVAGVDLERLASTGIFNMDHVRSLMERAHDPRPAPDQQPAYIMLWLATFTRLYQWLDELGIEVEPVRLTTTTSAFETPAQTQTRSGLIHQLRHRLQRSPVIRRWVHEARCYVLRRQAKRNYPPRVRTSSQV